MDPCFLTDQDQSLSWVGIPELLNRCDVMHHRAVIHLHMHSARCKERKSPLSSLAPFLPLNLSLVHCPQGTVHSSRARSRKRYPVLGSCDIYHYHSICGQFPDAGRQCIFSYHYTFAHVISFAWNDFPFFMLIGVSKKEPRCSEFCTIRDVLFRL